MKIILKVFIALALTCSLASSAENISGRSLLLDLGARGTGLAGAGTSLSGDVTFLKYNPASLASLTNPELSVFYYNGGELGINFGSMTYGQKFGPGVLALAVSYLNGGEMELNTSGGGTTTVVSQQDITGIVSYGLEPAKDIEIGISAKVLFSSLVGSLNGQTVCGDAGIQIKNVLMNNVNFGVAVLNIGTGIKYLDTTELLPATVAGGLSYFTNIDKMGLLVAVDGALGLSDSKQRVSVGAEVTYEDYSLRMGLPLLSTQDTVFTMGAGYRMKEFFFDYSVAFGKVLSLTHRVSIGMLFGELKEKEKTSESPVENKGGIQNKSNEPKNIIPEKRPARTRKEIK